MKNKNLDLKRYGLEAIDSNELETIEGGGWFSKLIMGIGWVIVAAGAGVGLIGALGVALFVGGVVGEINEAQNNPDK